MAISKKLRFEVFKRDGFQCQYCGKSPPEAILEVDHIVPKKRGGKDEIDNLITACFDCNRGKGSKELNIAPETLERKKEILKEKQIQLKEFFKYQEKINEEIQEMVLRLSVQWEELSENEYSLTDHGKLSIKNLLKKFTYTEILEAMEMSANNQRIDWDGKFSYMCGILWNKKRQREGRIDEKSIINLWDFKRLKFGRATDYYNPDDIPFISQFSRDEISMAMDLTLGQRREGYWKAFVKILAKQSNG